MSLVDYKGRNLKVGNRVRIENDIPSENEWNDKTKKIRVTDNLGKVWWIEPNEVSCSFL